MNTGSIFEEGGAFGSGRAAGGHQLMSSSSEHAPCRGCGLLPFLLRADSKLAGTSTLLFFAKVVLAVLVKLSEAASGGLIALSSSHRSFKAPSRGPLWPGLRLITDAGHCCKCRRQKRLRKCARLCIGGNLCEPSSEWASETTSLSPLQDYFAPVADLCLLKLLHGASIRSSSKALTDHVVTTRVGSVLVVAYARQEISALAALAAKLVHRWVADKGYAERSGGVYLPATLQVLRQGNQGRWAAKTRLHCLGILHQLAEHKLFSQRRPWEEALPVLVEVVQQGVTATRAQQTEAEGAARLLALLAQADDGDAFDGQICGSGAIQGLLGLLAGGRAKSKTTALQALCSILHWGDTSTTSVFGEQPGACAQVVEAMTGEAYPPACRALAVELSRVLAANRTCRRLLVQAGLIRGLVQVLNEQPLAAWNAARVLGLFARSARRAILEAGAIPPLIDLLHLPDEGDAEDHAVKCAFAANTLGLLAAVRDNRRSVAAAGAIPPLLHLLLEAPQLAKDAAEDALCILAVDFESAVQIMTGLVSPLAEGTPAQKALAADAVWTIIAAGHERSATLISSLPIIPLLLKLLTDFDPSAHGWSLLQDSASGALSVLADDDDNLPTILSVGAVPVLVDLLRGTVASSEAKESAAEILYKVCSVVPEEGRRLVLAAGGVPVLGKVLAEGTATMIEFAAKALRLLENGDSVEQSSDEDMSESEESVPESLGNFPLQDELEGYASEDATSMDNSLMEDEPG